MTEIIQGKLSNPVKTKNTEKTCAGCKEVKSIYDFTIKKSGYACSQCKKCRARVVSRINKEKRKERSPHLYLDCSNEECGNLFNKCYRICPKCGANGERDIYA